jgi:guanylate kinase
MGSKTKNSGPLIIVSGPSGVGKTTVVDELLKRSPMPLRRAITATTRSPRAGETEGVSYQYLNRDEFDRAVREGQMLEFAVVFGTDYYGTLRSEVDPHRADGVGVILVIDVQGAERVRALCPDAVSVFIRPPTFEELEARLRGRGDLTEDRIQRRLTTARAEMARAGEFDYVIINDHLDQAVGELESLVRARFTTGG